MIFTYICRDCGVSFEQERKQRTPEAQYCPACKKERIRARSARQWRERKKSDRPQKKSQKEIRLDGLKIPRHFVGTPPGNKCPMEHCRFRHADRPCLFYFEYKDGTATCANAAELNKFQKKQKILQTIED